MTKILLAFSWGHQFPNPGSSNEIIAKELIKIRNNFDFILVQIEIGESLKPFGVNPDYVTGEHGVYINTYEVVRAMASWLKSRQIDSSKSDISIICHKSHWNGLKLVLRKLQINAQRIPIDIPYDPNSYQWYTRGPLRALLGKFLHFFGYLLRGELF